METSITQIVAASNVDVEFVSNGRLYQLEITQDELDAAYGANAAYWENPYTGEGATDTECEMPLSAWKKLNLTEKDFMEVIVANQAAWCDVTECTDKGQELLKAQARKNLLSWIVTLANKLRSALKSMSLAMRAAWMKAKILATGIVKFVKIEDVKKEFIPTHTRRVVDGGQGRNGILLFTDLDKYEAALSEGLSEAAAKAKSYISMHLWQVVGWN